MSTSGIFPLIDHKMIVDVDGQYGRAMLRDARHLAPEPCRTCDKLQLARDEYNYKSLLVCGQPKSCPSIIHDYEVQQPEKLFLDITPVQGWTPIESPCKSCTFQSSFIDSYGATIQTCDRRRHSFDLCPVRGSITPDQWHSDKLIFDAEKEERDKEEFENELALMELMDEESYGTF